MKKYFSYIALLLILIPASLFSQEKTDDTKWTTRLDFMVPHPLSNKAFNLSFTGILDAGLNINRRVGNLFNIGIGYRYKQFQIRVKKIPDVDMLQLTHNGFVRLSADVKSGKGGLLSPAINVGYNMMNYTGIPCITGTPTGKNATGFNIEPSVSYIWMVDEGFGIGLMLNYNILTYEFDPDSVCLDEHKSYSDTEKTGLTSSFSVGFSVYIDFAHRAEGFED